MKKVFLALLILTIMFIGVSCNNKTAETPKDFNELSEEQQKICKEVSYDVTLAITKIKYDDLGKVVSKPNNIEVERVIKEQGNGAKVILNLKFSDYVGQTYGDKITGTILFNYYYTSIYDSFYSSMNGTMNLAINRMGDIHILSSNMEAKTNKDTGAIISSVETGTFDKAKYRESK